MVLQLRLGLGHRILLSTFSMIVTIYYLIPGLRDLFSFPMVLAGAGILLVGGGWVLGKILVKRFKIQPIENYISSEVNPFTNAALTAKERVYWNAMVVLLKKEHAHRTRRSLSVSNR